MYTAPTDTVTFIVTHIDTHARTHTCIHAYTVFPAEPSSRLQVGWGENESVGKGQPTRRNGVIPVPNFGGSNFLCSCSAKIRPKLVQARLGATATGG